MMELQALIFDVDGTLAETERDGHRVSFNRAFTEVGLDWEWSVETYGELLAITGGKERIRHYLEHYRPESRIPGDATAYIADLHRRKTAHYTAMVKDGAVSLRPGVSRLLAEARQRGLRLAIATTTSPDNVAALLTHVLGPTSRSWFEVIAAGDIVPAKKPAPDIYKYALGELKLPASACLALEDSANGLLSARAAGIPTVITTSSYTRQESFDGALLIMDNLGEPSTPGRVSGGDAAIAAAGNHACVDIDMLVKLHEFPSSAR
jgi:HAD superfamily hydrolase (TIGR01509 family)